MTSTDLGKLSATIKVLAGCFAAAEEQVRREIRQLLGTRNETQITADFYRALAHILLNASDEQRIAQAFEHDVHAFVSARKSDLPKDSVQGIGGRLRVELLELSEHSIQFEGKSGADFGIVVIAPLLIWKGLAFDVERRAAKRGLLVQAKLKRFGQAWPELSDPQIRLLSTRMEFISLLGYAYADTDNRDLDPFRWWPGKEHPVTDIESWLAQDEFPDAIGSATLITTLGNGEIGTPDDSTIDEIILPSSSGTLTVVVDWPDDDRNGPATIVNTVNKSLHDLWKKPTERPKVKARIRHQ